MNEQSSEENKIEKERTIKTLYIDNDSAMVRYIEIMAEGNPNIITAECNSFDEAFDKINEHNPDLLFIDNSLTSYGDEGLDIIRKLKESNSKIKIVSISNNRGVNKILKKEYDIENIEKNDYTRIKQIIDETQKK